MVLPYGMDYVQHTVAFQPTKAPFRALSLDGRKEEIRQVKSSV